MINIIEVLLNRNGVSDVPIDDDSLNNYYNLSYNEILRHNKSYSNLLKNYVGKSKLNSYLKITFKIIFFVFSMCIWYYMIKIFNRSFTFAFDIIKSSNDLPFMNICISLLGTILPSLISLITSFIVIPEIIAKYLFDTGEENSLIEIIKSLQSYDYKVYKEKMKFELIAHEQFSDNNQHNPENNQGA